MELTVSEHVVRINVIAVSGRLDAFSVAEFRETQDELLAKGNSFFVADLSNTEFMDSAGMAALVALLKRARQAGGEVVLVTPKNPAAYRILELTRFDQVFMMNSSVEDALKRFCR